MSESIPNDDFCTLIRYAHINAKGADEIGLVGPERERAGKRRTGKWNKQERSRSRKRRPPTADCTAGGGVLRREACLFVFVTSSRGRRSAGGAYFPGAVGSSGANLFPHPLSFRHHVFEEFERGAEQRLEVVCGLLGPKVLPAGRSLPCLRGPRTARGIRQS